jgi:superfamily II DNA or RNA helicase
MTEQPTLRPYQVEVTADFNRAVENGQRRVLLVAPTASGKTVIGAAIIKSSIGSKACWSWPIVGKSSSKPARN